MSTFDIKKFLIDEGMTRVSRDRKKGLVIENRQEEQPRYYWVIIREDDNLWVETSTDSENTDQEYFSDPYEAYYSGLEVLEGYRPGYEDDLKLLVFQTYPGMKTKVVEGFKAVLHHGQITEYID